MRSERLLSRLRRFINAIDATIVRSSSARTLFVSGASEWFFRSSFISSLFRISLVLRMHALPAPAEQAKRCSAAAMWQPITSEFT
jgi:hypothetical protein